MYHTRYIRFIAYATVKDKLSTIILYVRWALFVASLFFLMMVKLLKSVLQNKEIRQIVSNEIISANGEHYYVIVLSQASNAESYLYPSTHTENKSILSNLL